MFIEPAERSEVQFSLDSKEPLLLFCEKSDKPSDTDSLVRQDPSKSAHSPSSKSCIAWAAYEIESFESVGRHTVHSNVTELRY